jgi:uncharacterized protein (DUF58 family)
MAEERLVENVEFLAQLDYVQIIAKRFFGGRLLGARRSKRFGAGLEYADFRPYSEGDDARHLYWQAFLLHRLLVSKLYEETTELTLYLLIDTSASMARGTPSKLFYAKKIAAALAYTSLASLDRVVLLPFATDIQPARGGNRPLQGEGHLPNVLRILDALTAAGATDFERVFRQFGKRYQQRGLCIILSDFFDLKGYGVALKALHHNRFFAISIRINERDELAPTLRGDLEVVDCETGQREFVRVTPRVLEHYQIELERHYTELGHLSRAFGSQYAAAVTDVPFEQFLLSMFQRGILVR